MWNPSRRLVGALLLLGIVCLQPLGRVLAQQDTPVAEEATVPVPVPVVLTLSGGISLGAYQSGVNWALVSFFRRAHDDPGFRRRVTVFERPNHHPTHGWHMATHDTFPPIPRFRISAVAGASAGNINGILTALEWCSRPDSADSPEASSLWRVWVSTGWTQLFPGAPDGWPRAADEQGQQEEGIFHRAYFRDALYPYLAKRMREPTNPRKECDIPIGIPLTRVYPEREEHAEIHLMAQRFVTVFRMTTEESPAKTGGDGSGTPRSRRLVFRRDPATLYDKYLGRQIALPSIYLDRIHPDTVFALSAAASAFPGAFSPQTVHYFDAENITPEGLCRAIHNHLCEPRKQAAFSDGGIFDNNPLDLALAIHLSRRREADSLRLAAERQPAADSLPQRAYAAAKKVGTAIAAHTPTATDSPRVVYIDPDGLRGVWAELRQETHGPETEVRGMQALSTILSGAIPSARQYELHTLFRWLSRRPIHVTANSRDTLLFGDTTWLRTTDRAYPLMGEHLYAFGAFLGRPFREYDFFVGVYDGFHFLASDVLCSRDTLHETNTPARTDCIRGAIRNLIAKSVPWTDPSVRLLNLGVVGSTALASLHQKVTGEAVPLLPESASRADTLRMASLQADALAAVRDTLIRALIDAQQVRFDTLAARKCRIPTELDRLLCMNQLSLILERFQTPSVESLVNRWAHQCAKREYAKEEIKDLWWGSRVDTLQPRARHVPGNPDCLVDPTLRQLVRSQRVAVDNLVGAIIRQATLVEDREGHHRASSERLMEMVDLVYRSIAPRPPRHPIEPLPSTVPPYARWGKLARVLPYQASVNLGAAGWEAGYRPAVHLGGLSWLPFPQLRYNTGIWSIVLPVTLQYVPLSRSSPGLYYLFWGAGVLRRTSNPMLTEWEFSLQRLHACGHSMPNCRASEADAWTLEGATYLIGGKLRLSARAYPWRAPSYLVDHTKVRVSVGIADVPGLVYWFGRMAR